MLMKEPVETQVNGREIKQKTVFSHLALCNNISLAFWKLARESHGYVNFVPSLRALILL